MDGKEYVLGHTGTRDGSLGIRSRDWLASQAMQAVIAAGRLSLQDTDVCAEWSYKLADAMIRRSQVLTGE